MVAARKTPSAPAPSSSRSSSSQLPPRPKPKTPPTPAASTNGNLKAAMPPTKSKPKSPTPKKQKRTKSSFSFNWFIALLLGFFFYAMKTCPSDIPRTSPVCRSLDLYRTHVLDPYITPQLETLYHHADPYIAPVKPYASSAAELTCRHVIPRASAVLDFTLDKYTTHIAPRLHWFFVQQYWNGIIKPIYYKGLHPHLERHSRPYRIYYRKFIVPGIKNAAARANATYIKLRPHAEYYLSEAQRHTITAYEKTRPHAIQAYRRVRPHALALFEKAKFHALVLANKAGDARRQYVDPHILRIWEKVSEPSNTASYSAPTPTQALEDTPTPTRSSSIVDKPIIPTTVPAPAEPEPEQEAEPEATAAPQESTAAPELTPQASSSSSSSPEAHSDIPPSSASAQVHTTPVPAAEHEAESAASVVAASLHAAAEVTPGSGPESKYPPGSESESESEPESAPEPEDEYTEDIDDFLKDIGISSDDGVSTEPSIVESAQASEEVNPDPEPPRPTYGDPPPSPADRVALTAKKRAEITSRHAKWQAELDALVREQMHGVRTFLAASRGAAVGKLVQWGVVAEVEGEAGRLVRGVEGYLRGVEERGGRGGEGKGGKEKRDKDREMWNRVVEKVESRFAEKVRDVHKEVHEWFVGVHERERQEIDAIVEKVKLLADRAQADLGLDYAWLDDVTYYDWQKYHDLMRTSENFTSHAQKIQAQIEPEGTNELIDALNELEREVNEVVEGFSVVIADVRRRAEGDGGVFAGDAGDDAELESDREEEGEGEEVSILPVEPEVKDVPVEGVFVGRAKEEVEAKLEGVRVEDVRARREEL